MLQPNDSALNSILRIIHIQCTERPVQGICHNNNEISYNNEKAEKLKLSLT